MKREEKRKIIYSAIFGLLFIIGLSFLFVFIPKGKKIEEVKEKPKIVKEIKNPLPKKKYCQRVKTFPAPYSQVGRLPKI